MITAEEARKASDANVLAEKARKEGLETIFNTIKGYVDRGGLSKDYAFTSENVKVAYAYLKNEGFAEVERQGFKVTFKEGWYHNSEQFAYDEFVVSWEE